MSATVAINDRNRANAQHSTGPKSDEGKRRVAQNARTLGLCVADGTLEQEDPQDLAEIIAGYTLEYCPRGILDCEMVRQISMATHRLRRLERIETAIMHRDEIAHTRFEADVILAKAFQNDQMPSLLRARAAAERSFHRAYKALEERKSKRVFDRAPPPELRIEPNLKHAPMTIKPVLQNKPSADAPAATQPPG